MATQTFLTSEYNLDLTLGSGQAFRWRKVAGSWEGVVSNRWVRLTTTDNLIEACTPDEVEDWTWLASYLQLHISIADVVRTFPDDAPMRQAAQYCRGLRLLRQDPWECLASFILSSNKQIVQIQQILSLLTTRHGVPVKCPDATRQAFSFPAPSRIATLAERELRECKMGFRAPYLLATAREVTDGFDLPALAQLDVAEARMRLMTLPGVGRKIADCILLFAFGFPTAFPIDVWVLKALQQLYFPREQPNPSRLRRFVESYFGPHAGYAQQYLFHYVRTCPGAFPAKQTRKPVRLLDSPPTRSPRKTRA